MSIILHLIQVRIAAPLLQGCSNQCPILYSSHWGPSRVFGWVRNG